VELELHECVAGHPGTIRLLGYLNHARMGNYGEAIAAYRTGIVDTPDITATRLAGRTKYGVGFNLQQQVTTNIRLLARLGWSDGRNESFAYTEIDNTIELGFDVTTGPWGRSRDQFGLAAVSSGLSDGHRTYLALGGEGFLLGDGKLHYGRENIVEAYYTAQLRRGIFPSIDVQLVDAPGFNKDRGPVVVFTGRLHVEI
jgi:carbohydrate-selective porin OprB